jgi:uncharacterized protein (TIGR00251 family)
MQYLRIKVTPNSRNSKITQTLDDGTIKISVKAAPENGKANQEVIKILAEHFKADSAKIKIVSGHISSIKLIRINYD